ncbi:MAG: restriction endonuclease subunit M, partial [Candidatus Omnitrophica bacterium CG12_big_fil_rev_8_21_14_0_65_42_8]
GFKEIEEGENLQKQILGMLAGMDASKIHKNRPKFVEILEKKTEELGLRFKASVMSAIFNALSERDETADVCLDKDGKPEHDSELRDCEKVPLGEDIDRYFKREVLPHVPDAWMDRSKDRIGYEINLTKEFYKFKPLRSLEEIRKDILVLERETEGLMGEVLDG